MKVYVNKANIELISKIETEISRDYLFEKLESKIEVVFDISVTDYMLGFKFMAMGASSVSLS